jgi:hypothetical protein
MACAADLSSGARRSSRALIRGELSPALQQAAVVANSAARDVRNLARAGGAPAAEALSAIEAGRRPRATNHRCAWRDLAQSLGGPSPPGIHGAFPRPPTVAQPPQSEVSVVAPFKTHRS